MIKERKTSEEMEADDDLAEESQKENTAEGSDGEKEEIDYDAQEADESL